MPQIFDVIANENARYKRNELEYKIFPEICEKCEKKLCFYPKIKVIFLTKDELMLYMDMIAHMIPRHMILKLEVYGNKKI